MSQVTLTVAGKSVTIEGEVSVLSSILAGFNFTETQTAPAAVSVPATPEELSLKFIDFFEIELEKHIKGGKFFVSEMNRLRTHKNNNYKSLISVYHDLVNKNKKGWAKRRQLLLTASKIWRYTFKPTANRSRIRYELNAILECTDCGEFATAMVKRMQKENLWV